MGDNLERDDSSMADGGTCLSKATSDGNGSHTTTSTAAMGFMDRSSGLPGSGTLCVVVMNYQYGRLRCKIMTLPSSP